MNNSADFHEFFCYCKTKRIVSIQLAEANLIANPASGDFGSIVVEFQDCVFFITAKGWENALTDDDPINEFCIQRFKSLDDISDEITKNDVYTTISGEDSAIRFLAELVDAQGYFSGMELKVHDFYLFILVDCPCIVVTASYNEELKYFLYPHQFPDYPDFESSEYVMLFPEG